MNKVKIARKIYKFSALVVLGAGLFLFCYLLYSGIKAKNIVPEAIEVTTQETPEKVIPLDKSYGLNLISDKIGLSTPITIDVDGNNKAEYNKALENGVAHLKGSAAIGKYGNSFIFGHSSYYPEAPGNYKEVFAKINELITGDLLEIQTEDARYSYRISDKKIVGPNEVSVANQDMSLKQLTLMTCWPIGTTDKRLIIVSELIDQLN